jgi:uncharacterized cupredoxin-like copper-binding protein
VRTRTAVVSALVLVVALTACGGDDDTASGSGGSADAADAESTVEVLAEDISFPQDVYETEAGSIGFDYVNVGQIRHTLLIEDASGETLGGFELTVNANGDEDQGVIDLEAGSYVLYCDVAGHRAAGMVADLAVG